MCFCFGRVWSPVAPCWVMCFVFLSTFIQLSAFLLLAFADKQFLSRPRLSLASTVWFGANLSVFVNWRFFWLKSSIFVEPDNFLSGRDIRFRFYCSPREMSWEVGNFWPQFEDPRSGMSFEETPESPIYLRSQEGVMKANNRKVIWYIPQKWNLIYEASFDQHVWKPRDENKFWASTRLPPWLTWSSSSWHPDPPGRWPRPTYITPPPTSPAVPYMM